MSDRRKAKSSVDIPSDIRSRAMLARLRIRRWGAKANSTEAAAELADQKHANPELMRVTTLLLKSDALDDHRKASRAARKRFKFYTAPWDDGVGLLPSKLFFKLKAECGELISKADGHADQFVREYTEAWNDGLKEYRDGLGDMFNESLYPHPREVKAKFGISLRAFPITDPNDFRVKMSADVAAKIKEQITEDVNDSLKEAMRDPVRRLHEAIVHVHEKLKDPEAIFRDSIIGNVQKLVDILPDLNFLEDPELNKIIKAADKEICGVSDVGALRSDPRYRKDVAASAAAILKQMKGYGA